MPRISGSDYIVKEKFRILAGADVWGNDERLMLPWQQNHTQIPLTWIQETPQILRSKLRVVLSPTHRRIDRQWSKERWCALADHLVSDFGFDVIWIWGPGEKETVDDLQKNCKTTTFVAPKTNFRELAALVAQCELFIGNSNGPSHVAVAVNTCSLQLHGPTDAPSWCPLTNRHRAVAKTSMDEIACQEVFDTVAELSQIALKDVAHRNQLQCDQDVWTFRQSLEN